MGALNWLAPLSGILGLSAGGYRPGVEAADAERLKQQQLDETRAYREGSLDLQRQNLAAQEAARYVDVPGAGKMPAALGAQLYARTLAREDEAAKWARELEQVGQIAGEVQNIGSRRGPVAESYGDVGATMETPPTVRDPNMVALSRVLRGFPLGEAAKTAHEFFKPRDPKPPIQYDPTKELRDPTGLTVLNPATPKPPKPNLSQSVEDILQGRGIDPATATAAQVAAAREQKIEDDIRVFGAKNEIAIQNRPPEAADRQAIGVHTQTLNDLKQLQSFTPKEIQDFSGAIRGGGRKVLLALRGTLGISTAEDQRFADFDALMGRLQGTAFGEGGKQLTSTELVVVRRYTPTGRELGGATEMLAKAKQLARYATVSRQVRIELAKSGRSTIDPDELDRQIHTAYYGAGLGSGLTIQPPAAPQSFDQLPPPAQMAGTILRNAQTGQRVKSDGQRWVPVP